MAYKHIVSFQKEFLDGPMKGIKLWAEYRSPDLDHAERDVAKLHKRIGLTRKTCTGEKYRILDVMCFRNVEVGA